LPTTPKNANNYSHLPSKLSATRKMGTAFWRVMQVTVGHSIVPPKGVFTVGRLGYLNPFGLMATLLNRRYLKIRVQAIKDYPDYVSGCILEYTEGKFFEFLRVTCSILHFITQGAIFFPFALLATLLSIPVVFTLDKLNRKFFETNEYLKQINFKARKAGEDGNGCPYETRKGEIFGFELDFSQVLRTNQADAISLMQNDMAYEHFLDVVCGKSTALYLYAFDIYRANCDERSENVTRNASKNHIRRAQADINLDDLLAHTQRLSGYKIADKAMLQVTGIDHLQTLNYPSQKGWETKINKDNLLPYQAEAAQRIAEAHPLELTRFLYRR